jgi:hypothetical protein
MSTYPWLRILQFYLPLWGVIAYNVYHIGALMLHLRALTRNVDSQVLTPAYLYFLHHCVLARLAPLA